jgi:hypothetical protein
VRNQPLPKPHSKLLPFFHFLFKLFFSSAPFPAFALRHPHLYQFLNECNWQWLVYGEVDCSSRCREALQFVLKRLDHRCSWEQAAMVRKSGEPYQHSFALECRNPVADGLSSFRGHNGSNRLTHRVQIAAGWFRDTGKVLINVFRSALAFRRRAASAAFRFLHVVMLQKIPLQIHAPNYRGTGPNIKSPGTPVRKTRLLATSCSHTRSQCKTLKIK